MTTASDAELVSRARNYDWDCSGDTRSRPLMAELADRIEVLSELVITQQLTINLAEANRQKAVKESAAQDSPRTVTTEIAWADVTWERVDRSLWAQALNKARTQQPELHSRTITDRSFREHTMWSRKVPPGITRPFLKHIATGNLGSGPHEYYIATWALEGESK